MSSTPLTNKRPLTFTLSDDDDDDDDDEKENIPPTRKFVKRAARRCNDMI